MKRSIRKKSIFIGLYSSLLFLLLYFTKDHRPLADLGINILSIGAYLITLVWMIKTFNTTKDKQRYFWLFFAIGIGFLFLSKLTSSYYELKYINSKPQMISGTDKQHNPVEDMIRLVGYLFFFTGFIYKMKLIKNTLPMLRFLVNIVMVIISVYCVSWQFLVHPLLVNNHNVTQVGSILSSMYHVLNISLLFAAVYLIVTSKDKTSLYLIGAGILIQVVGDFFYMNHVKHVGYWLFIFWPMSVLLMGLAANFEKESSNQHDKQTEKLEYKQYSLSYISAGILLLFTFYNQLQETALLQKGLHFTVFLLLLQQIITAIENKTIFTKLKQLAGSVGNVPQGKGKQDSEMTSLLTKIEKLAHYDPLTDLPNRNLFQKRMEQQLKAAKEKGQQLALMYIDLDRFKYVNDSLGHDSGDALLKEVAGRLMAAVDPRATVARIGGDEFSIILPEGEKNKLEQIANHILQRFEFSFMINDHELYTTPSIGISIFPEGGTTTNELLKSADTAMYSAKEEGKNNYQFFNPDLNKLLMKKIQMETRLRKAIEENQFSLYYQPQVDLRSEKMIGLEALIRWNDPAVGMVSPVEFIPLAEETGLIEPIGLWVMKTACHQLKTWQQLDLTDVTMSVNVSIRQFQNPNFVADVKMILAETKLAPQYLKIEITESILQDINKTIKVLNELQAIGIQIAIDDFGTGYSSLSYLKNLPVNTLKIDKAFIVELSINADSPIVKTIIDMGRNMNFTVIAEGVESTEHVAFLRKNKCYVGQGYLFSKPLPSSELENFLHKEALRIS